ncbi:MAG: pinensin family lanthipeptide [Bacteroidota bacterium]
MTKKITLSELKLKSSVTELNQDQRKAAKGGYIQIATGRTERIGKIRSWIADTQVDIRLHEGTPTSENDHMTP